MRLTQSWNDPYGSVCAHYQGRPGGAEVLVSCPPALAHEAAAALVDFGGKGRAFLLVHEGLTPLMAALRELTPRALVVLGGELAGGDAAAWAHEAKEGEFLGFRDAFSLPAWENAAPLPGSPRGASPAAALGSSLGYRVAVCAPARLGEVLPALGLRLPVGV